MIPKLSIIIPCYNSADTLDETLESVHRQRYKNWEALIINDGSTDYTAEIARQWLERDKRFSYYSKENEGLSKTRNFGIRRAQGKYILPLDSDNLLEANFSFEALNLLEKKEDPGVVHGFAEYIGEKSGIWKIRKFDFEKILVKNYIDACAVFSKVLWEEVGGYDEKMPYQGNEDWDLWIEFGKRNVKFYHLNKITFKYRVNRNSMIKTFSNEMFESNRRYLADKNSLLYFELAKKLHFQLIQWKENPIKSALLISIRRSTLWLSTRKMNL